MASSGKEMEAEFFENKISAEIDEYGDLAFFEFKNGKIKTTYKKKQKKKDRAKKEFDITGIPQLGTDSPYPDDREDLIEKEYSTEPLLYQAWVAVIITVLAMVFDAACYIYMFEKVIYGTNAPTNPSSSESIAGKSLVYLSAIAAALAIDILPIFFARILHTITKNKKMVLHVFFILSLFFVIIVIVAIVFVRLQFFSKFFGIKPDLIVIQMLVPIATSLVCFIFNFLCYNPYRHKILTLRKSELWKQESINELNAVIKEIESDIDFEARIKKIDDDLYQSTQGRIDAISAYYKTLVRTALMQRLHSPADTSDLSIKNP